MGKVSLVLLVLTTVFVLNGAFLLENENGIRHSEMAAESPKKSPKLPEGSLETMEKSIAEGKKGMKGVPQLPSPPPAPTKVRVDGLGVDQMKKMMAYSGGGGDTAEKAAALVFMNPTQHSQIHKFKDGDWARKNKRTNMEEHIYPSLMN